MLNEGRRHITYHFINASLLLLLLICFIAIISCKRIDCFSSLRYLAFRCCTFLLLLSEDCILPSSLPDLLLCLPFRFLSIQGRLFGVLRCRCCALDLLILTYPGTTRSADIFKSTSLITLHCLFILSVCVRKISLSVYVIGGILFDLVTVSTFL